MVTRSRTPGPDSDSSCRASMVGPAAHGFAMRLSREKDWPDRTAALGHGHRRPMRRPYGVRAGVGLVLALLRADGEGNLYVTCLMPSSQHQGRQSLDHRLTQDRMGTGFDPALGDAASFVLLCRFPRCGRWRAGRCQPPFAGHGRKRSWSNGSSPMGHPQHRHHRCL